MVENQLAASILIISDTASQDASADKCGPILRDVFENDEKASFTVTEVGIVADDVDAIQEYILRLCDNDEPVNLIITSGGTGFAAKDKTPEAVTPLIQKHASGLVHAMLSTSLEVTPFAMMARPVAGVRNKTLIITLPGSPKGAKENLEALIRQLPHACQQAAGADSRQLHAGGVQKLEKDAGVSSPSSRDSSAPKSGQSAYMFFARDQRDKIPKERPDLQFGQVGNYIADTWKALPDLERAPFERLADADQKRFLDQTSAYQKLQQEQDKRFSQQQRPSHSHNSQSHSHAHSHTHSHEHGKVPGGHTIPVAHTDRDSHPQSNDPNAGPSRRYRASPYPMLEVDAALQLIRQHTPTAKAIQASVNESLVGSILAEDVKAVESVPAFRASIVDGYAIRIPDSGTFTKGVYPVSLISHAQASNVATLEEGSIARITTGAPLPPGADAVVMVEDTVLISKTADDREEKDIEILTSEIKSGENVREVGSDVRAGTVIMKKGEGITAVGGELGLLASTGVQIVTVYQKPIIGVLSTGDEIVPHDRAGALRLGEVRDTNRPTLITAVKGSGFEVRDLGIASDKPGALESTLRSAFTDVDILITTGGVSMGELDLLKPTIERALGGIIHFGRVNMKPGKPTTFGTLSLKSPLSGLRVPKLIFSLPGNPASAIVCYHLFVLPSLHHASGISPAGLPKVTVVLETEVKCDKSRPEYHRVVVAAKRDGMLYASSTGMQRSSRVGSFKSANALLCLPAGKGTLSKGEKVQALLMGKVVGDFA